MMLAQKALTIRPDAHLRQQWFGANVMRHPAKQSLAQLIHLLERFAVRGGVLLDPFGGSGSSMVACAPSYGGMYVVTVELAAHFLPLQDQAWQHFQCAMEMQDVWGTPPGEYLSLQGDSRDLAHVLQDTRMVDLIITSPSYGGSEAVDQRKTQNTTIAAHGGGKGNRNVSVPQAYDVDLVITSPPYQDAVGHSRERGLHADAKRIAEGKIPASTVVKMTRNSMATMGSYDASRAYDTTPENIGNLKGTKYLVSMRAVWKSCAEVLKPGGILCCITRDCVRKSQRVPVGEQNKALLLEAGLEFIECETWAVPNMSFWRILQQRKNPDAPLINTEDVWIFRKPLEAHT